MCKRNYFRIFIYILFNSFYSSYFLMFSHFFVFYTFFIDDVGVKSNCTISSDFNIILRKRTTAKTENPVFLQWFFSCLNRFKSNARETWHAILVSFADIYLTVMNAGNNIRRPIWCVHTAGRSDLSQSFLSVSGYVHLRYAHLPDIHNPRQC